jgi:CubicO group peptidase (beta-lactamase class C family)
MLTTRTRQRIDGIVARTPAASQAPSLAAAVIRDGVLTHHSAAGTNPTPSPDHQYRLGSIIKTMTAAALLGPWATRASRTPADT